MKELKAMPGIEKVTLTTNGLLLGAFLDEARTLNAMPDAVNISLDALDRNAYGRISRTNDAAPGEITGHAERLLEMKIPVKFNCVPVRGYNENDILPLTLLVKDKNAAVRFIELMPLGCAAGLEPVSGADVAAILEKEFGALTPCPEMKGNGPAVYYSLPGFKGRIGFINPVSHGFCETCNRLRLTSEGFLKPCLSYDLGVDLRKLLRSGAKDGELSAAITEAAAAKPHFHTLSTVYGASPEDMAGQHGCGMSAIGG
jgi:cyclic pyranopterin phosphate synthase